MALKKTVLDTKYIREPASQYSGLLIKFCFQQSSDMSGLMSGNGRMVSSRSIPAEVAALLDSSHVGKLNVPDVAEWCSFCWLQRSTLFHFLSAVPGPFHLLEDTWKPFGTDHAFEGHRRHI